MQIALDAGFPFGVLRQFTVPVMIGSCLMLVGVALLIMANNRKQLPVALAKPGIPPVKAQHVWKGGLALLIIGVLVVTVDGQTRAHTRPGALGSNQVVLAASAGGLPKVETPEWVLREPGVVKGMLVASYVHPRYLHARPPMQTSLVYFFGTEGSYDPQSDLKRAFDDMTAKAPTVDGVHSYDAGPLGGLLQCASFAVSGQVQANCYWVDSSTTGHLVAAELTEPDVAALLLKMRPDLEKPR